MTFMNVYILFFAGLISGLIMSYVQKGKYFEPAYDAIFGMIGALVVGTVLTQYISFSAVVVILGILGAVAFIEIGRVIPEPH